MLDPILEALILFQSHVFTEMYSIYYPLGTLVDMNEGTVEGFEAKRSLVEPLIEAIAILNLDFKKLSPTGNVHRWCLSITIQFIICVIST
jgi:hypothetical protein